MLHNIKPSPLGLSVEHVSVSACVRWWRRSGLEGEASPWSSHRWWEDAPSPWSQSPILAAEASKLPRVAAYVLLFVMN